MAQQTKVPIGIARIGVGLFFTKKAMVALLTIAGLVALLAPAGPVRAAGKTYYVAKNGSDSSNGSISSPWLTIQHAADTVVAGDTVYVRDGTYSEYVYIGTSGPYVGKSGTSSSPITYKAYPGEHPIIDGTGVADPGWRGLITIYNLSYITISDFEIRNTPEKGVLIFGNSSYVTLTNLKVHGTTESGIYVETSSNVLIDSCEVYDTNKIVDSDEQVSMISSSNFEIRNSRFHNSGKNALDFKRGSSGGLIHDNEIYGTNDTTTGIYIDANGYAQDNFKIYDNKIHDLTGPAIVLGSEASPYPAITNVDIYNNLIYNNATGFAVWPNPFTRNYRIVNNTFYKNGAEIAIYGTGSTAGVNSNSVIRNNIIVASGDYLISYEGYASGGSITVDHNLYYDTAGIYRIYPSSMLGGSYVKANPLLNNPTQDFNIASNSPAKDAGSATLAPPLDYAGIARPQGPEYDIGAYEYLTSPSVLSVSTGSLPNGTVGATYSQSLAASGGMTPYNWTVASGTLPWGISLSSSGVISGTPTTAGGPTSTTFRVSDAVGATATKLLSITVGAAYAVWDVNQDGVVNVLDMIIIGQHWGETGTPGWISEDVNKDGAVNTLDSILVGQHWTG